MTVSEEELSSLSDLLNSYNGKISMKIVRADGEYGMSYNSTAGFFSACTIKAGYMLYCYKQIEQGNGSLEETMTYTDAFYHGGTGSIKNSASGTVYTLQEIMYRTLWESDNSGYDMCIYRWGKEGYNEMVRNLGCETFLLNSNSCWVYNARAEELVILWKEIYKYFQENSENAGLLYDSCTQQKYNFLGNALPSYTISQKYGWSDDAYSDGGIIYGQNGDYLFAIFTDSGGESYDMQTVNNVMAQAVRIMEEQ